MNSDEERALFELYRWSQDMIQRRWLSPPHHDGDGGEFRTQLTFDEVVSFSQTYEREQELRRFILKWGRPIMESEWGVPMFVVRHMSQAMIGRYSPALVLFWGPQALKTLVIERASFHKDDKLVRVVGMN